VGRCSAPRNQGHTQLDVPVAVAVDGAGQIYVLNLRANSLNRAWVTVYARGASGDAAPIRTITSSALDSEFIPASGLAVDEAGEIFISFCWGCSFGSSCDNVAVFPAGTQGLAVPAQTITDGINFPTGLAVSRGGNFLYVVNGDGAITVYHRAFGFFSLVHSIPPPANVSTAWKYVAVDSAGLIYAVPAFVGASPGAVPNVFVFQRDAANATFVKVGQFCDIVGDVSAIAVDQGFVYMTIEEPSSSSSGGAPFDTVRVFSSNSRGLSQIFSTIAGPSSRLTAPVGIAIIP
jgi:hypothetical protein